MRSLSVNVDMINLDAGFPFLQRECDLTHHIGQCDVFGVVDVAKVVGAKFRAKNIGAFECVENVGNALMNIINALHRLLVKVRCKLPMGGEYRICIHSLDDTRLWGGGLLN